MNLLQDFPSFESLALDLDPALIKNFKTFYEEARFGLILIQDDLINERENSNILEIGSGIGLLSAYLSSKGFNVTAIEPSAQGFGFMSTLQRHVLDYFDSNISKVSFSTQSLEDFSTTKKFKYIFSINVLEHLGSPEIGLEKTFRLMDNGGSARFIAPNYRFPYEPHFNIPIIVNKRLTYRVFRRHIESYDCSDAIGLWKSLNWVSAVEIERYLAERGIKGFFSKRALNHYFERIYEEGQFQERKGRIFIRLAKVFRLGANLIPIKLNPVIDLKLSSE